MLKSAELLHKFHKFNVLAALQKILMMKNAKIIRGKYFLEFADLQIAMKLAASVKTPRPKTKNNLS